MNVKLIASCLASVGVLMGCGISVPIQVVPPDLDVLSPQAPQCGLHPYPFTALSNAEEGLVLVKAQVDAAGVVGPVAVAYAIAGADDKMLVGVVRIGLQPAEAT